jgi:hypothetical protein
MAYSFNPSLPTLRDQVRMRLQDTNINNSGLEVFQDETIDAMLAQYSYDEACAQLAESAAAYFAQQATSIDNGPIKYQYEERSKFYLSLSNQIRQLASPPPGAPVWTGATGGQMAAPDLSKYRTD